MPTHGYSASALTPREITSLVGAALDRVGIDGPARWDVLAAGPLMRTLLLETRQGYLVLKLAPGSQRETFEARAAIYDAVGARGLGPRPLALAQIGTPAWCALALRFVRGATVERYTARTFAAAGRLIARLDLLLADFSESCAAAQGLPALELARLVRDAQRAARAAPEPWSSVLTDAVAHLERRDPHPPQKRRLVHGDLHFGNILRTRRGFVAVDFDEAGWGVRGFDLTTLLAQPIFAGEAARARAVLAAYVEHVRDGGEALRTPGLVPYLAARLTWVLACNAASATPRQLAMGTALLDYSLEVAERSGTLSEWAAGLPESR